MFADLGEENHPHEELGVQKFLLSFLYSTMFYSAVDALVCRKGKKKKTSTGRGIMKREKGVLIP